MEHNKPGINEKGDISTIYTCDSVFGDKMNVSPTSDIMKSRFYVSFLTSGRLS